jgi:bacterial/archaeal transporter family-2 protein
MVGMICSILAGIFMSLQGVFNTRVSQKIGSWETNTLVQGSGLMLTLAILFFAGNGSFKKIKEVNSLYLVGGLIGVFIIFTVMKGIQALGPTYSIAIILIAQLLSAACIDIFGLFDTTPVVFHFSKMLGIFLMIAGIVLFKLK